MHEVSQIMLNVKISLIGCKKSPFQFTVFKNSMEMLRLRIYIKLNGEMNVIFNFHTSDSRGVAILFGKNLDVKIVSAPDGRGMRLGTRWIPGLNIPKIRTDLPTPN